MSVIQVDGNKLVYMVLAADAPLTTLVTNVVDSANVLDMYGPPGLPIAFEIRPALFYLDGGGPGEEKIPISREVYDFYCYGRSPAEAKSVYNALNKCLHRRTHSQHTLSGNTYIFQHAQRMGGPRYIREPVEGWDRYYVTYLIHFIETTT